MAAQVPGDGGDQAVGRRQEGVADVGQHEAAGAVGDLGRARGEAALAEEGRLLVAGHPADRHAGQRRDPHRRRVHGAEPPAGGADLGEGRGVHPEEAAELLCPAQPEHVEEQRARGVGDVGGEHPAVRGRRSAATAPTSRPWPGPAGRPGPARPDRRRRASRRTWWPRSTGRGRGRCGPAPAGRWPASRSSSQRSAVRRSCHTMAGPSGPPCAVPGHGGLALVGDAQRGHRRPRPREPTADLGQGGPHGVPDLVGVVLHPARTGEVLGELAVGEVEHRPALVDHQGADPGGAGVDRHHARHRRRITGPRGGGRARRGRSGAVRLQTFANGPPPGPTAGIKR